jgi:hypothetical protein
LKIDIEGYEDRALLPYLDTVASDFWPKAIVIEKIHGDRWREDVLSIMLERGYCLHGGTKSNAFLIRS